MHSNVTRRLLTPAVNAPLSLRFDSNHSRAPKGAVVPLMEFVLRLDYKDPFNPRKRAVPCCIVLVTWWQLICCLLSERPKRPSGSDWLGLILTEAFLL